MNDPAFSQGPPGQPGFQQPGPFAPPYPPPYPPPKQGMSGGKLALIIVGVVFGVLFLGGVLVGVLAVATIPKLTEAKTKLESKHLGDLHNSMMNIAADDAKKRKLRAKDYKNTRGEEFWMMALQAELIDPKLSKKLVSLNSKSDTPLPPGQEHSAIGSSGHCSYTAPIASELLMTMSLKGNKRCVLITLNSRNWDNYPDGSVPCVWSDGDVITWMTFDDAQAEYGITAAEWADPAGKLFGKKAPFEHTYD